VTHGNGIVALERVSKVFEPRSGLFGPPRKIRAVMDVSFEVARAEAFGLVGESGSGKTTLARLMAGLVEPTSGRILFDGRDLALLSGSETLDLRRSLQIVFQDPVSALDPRQTVFQALAEVLRVRGETDCDALRERCGEALKTVDLRFEDADRYPHELSGGQCQRVGIARALISSPAVLVADEPVSQLDVSTQAEILSLLGRLRSDLGLTLVLVAHDLSVVRQTVDRVAVMLNGWIVEIAPTGKIFSNPLHPFTRALLEAVPKPGGREEREGDKAVGGRFPGASDGDCPFLDRCPERKADCEGRPVDLIASGSPEHSVRCRRA